MLKRVLKWIRARLPRGYEYLAGKALERARRSLEKEYFVDIGHPRFVIVGEEHREIGRMVSTGALYRILHAYLEEMQNHKFIPEKPIIIYHEAIESMYPAAEHILESSALRTVLDALGHKIRRAKDTWERVRILSDFLRRLAKLDENERLLLAAPSDALGAETAAYVKHIITEKLGLKTVPEANIPFYSLHSLDLEDLAKVEQMRDAGRGFAYTWFLHRLQTDVLRPLGLEILKLHCVEKPRDREVHKKILESLQRPIERPDDVKTKIQLEKLEAKIAAERTRNMLREGINLLENGHPLVILVVGAYHAGVSCVPNEERRKIAKKPLEEVRQELGGMLPTIVYAKELDPERLFNSSHREIREPR